MSLIRYLRHTTTAFATMNTLFVDATPRLPSPFIHAAACRLSMRHS